MISQRTESHIDYSRQFLDAVEQMVAFLQSTLVEVVAFVSPLRFDDAGDFVDFAVQPFDVDGCGHFSGLV